MPHRVAAELMCEILEVTANSLLLFLKLHTDKVLGGGSVAGIWEWSGTCNEYWCAGTYLHRVLTYICFSSARERSPLFCSVGVGEISLEIWFMGDPCP